MRAASSRCSTAASSSNTAARPETRGGVGPMWRNYLTVALRALAKNRAYTIINIAGLSLGIAACLLILSYVRYEFSYDECLPDSENVFPLQDFSPATDEGGDAMKLQQPRDRKSGLSGKRVAVRVDHVGSRTIKKTRRKHPH